MTDAPPAPASLLNKIKEAMGTYDYACNEDMTGSVHRTSNGVVVRECRSEAEAVDVFLDLNARAVIDAIVGALRWEKSSNRTHEDVCKIGCFRLGDVGEYPRLPSPSWLAEFGDRQVWFATESEAQSAVVAAFREALLSDGVSAADS